MTPPHKVATTPAQQALTWGILAWLMTAAAYYALTTLFAIVNFAWPQLAFDQFRSYTFYLGLPFPESVLAMENGHRPIVPALLRVAEIHWFQANQYLQIGFGTLCATLTASIIAVTAWRERQAPLLVRGAGVLLAIIGIFWLGNARMLLHGTESEHAYLVMLCLVSGAVMVRLSATQDSALWMLGAALTCVIATFTFGAGIALFPTFLFLGWLLRARWRDLLIILMIAALCFILYVFVLPGENGVRGSLDLRPIDSLSITPRWLASPWITGWLGFADPQTHQITIRGGLAGWLKASANALQSLLHIEWKTTGALLIGSLGLVLAATAFVMKARRRGPMPAIQSMALALIMFTTASAVLISISRLRYLEQHPGQIFSDRYLLWPCLFWMGIGLWLLSTFRDRPVWLRNGLIAFVALLPIVLLPFHRYGEGWGASVYRLNQATAAAGMTDLFDDRLFDTGADASLEQRVLSYQLLRERNLGPFRFAGSNALGSTLDAEPSPSHDISVAMEATSTVKDARDATIGGRFGGIVRSGIKAIDARGPLAVIDADRKIVGYAMFSHVGKPRRSLSFSLPMKRGFDGYIKNFQGSAHYRLVSLSSEGSHGQSWLLAEIPPATP